FTALRLLRGPRAPRSCLRRCRAALCRGGRAPRPAARVSGPRRAAPRRFRVAGRSPRAPFGPLRRSSRLLDAGAEAALGELDVDRFAGSDRVAGAHDSAGAPNDCVAALEGRAWGERRQPRGRLVEAPPPALEQEPWRAAEPLVGPIEALPLAIQGPARSALEARSGPVEPLHELGEIGDDEAGSDARSRGARVGR